MLIKKEHAIFPYCKVEGSSSAEFLIFERQTRDKGVQVRFEGGDLWLTQKAIGELFNIDRMVVTKHIKNIYSEFELDEYSTSANFALVQKIV